MRGIGLWCVLALAPAGGLAGQWGVGVNVGIARYFGATAPAGDSDGASVRPYRPTTLGVTVGRDWGPVRVDLAFTYGEPGLAAEAPGGAFISTEDATFKSLSPDLTVRIARLGAGGTVRLGGGADLTLWSVTGFDDRLYAGGHVTLAYEWPVAGRLSGDLQAGAALSPSIFQASDLPPELERRMMVRPSITIGLRYR